jgi:hypothetical protein
VDHKQFDELVARLSNAPSRRDALKGALGGALSSIAIGLSVEDEAAAQTDSARSKGDCIRACNRDNDSARAKVRCIRKCNRKRKKCRKGTRHCGRPKRCFNLQTSERHCGRCGNACASDQICVSGECILRS